MRRATPTVGNLPAYTPKSAIFFTIKKKYSFFILIDDFNSIRMPKYILK